MGRLRRLRFGEWLAAAGGALLLASLFLNWYAATVDVGDGRFTGFESFDVLDIVLILIAALAIALAIQQAIRDSPALPVAASVLTVVFGALGVLLVAYRIVNQPGPNELVEVRAGAWVGLLATIAIAAGGWASLRNEHVRGLPPDPEPELRPAP